MLFNMRKASMTKVIATPLMAILIVAFAIWGIGPGILTGDNSKVATVGEQEITTQKFANTVQSRAQQLQVQFGGQMGTAELIKALNLDYQILQQMVTEAAVMEHARNLGLRPTDQQIAEELTSIEAFRTPDGRFSQAMMDTALQRAGMTQKDLLTDLRGLVTRQQLVDAMTSASPVPLEMARELYVWRAERRAASMITFKASDIADVPAPTDEAMNTYYEANKNSFMTPERRTYRYILLTPARFEKDVELTDADIELAYEDRASDYIQPELRGIQEVTLPSKEAADALIAAVNAGEDFVKAAAAASKFTEEEIDLGDLTKEDIARDYGDAAADAVFALVDGTVTEAIEGGAGWNVFRVSGITQGKTKTLESVREELVTALTQEHAIDKMFDFVPEIEDALAADGSIAAVAEKLSLDAATVTLVDRDGLNANGTPAISSAEEARIHQAAFTAEMGQEPEVTDLDPQDNTKGLFVMALDEVKEPELKPFEEVAASVRERLIVDAKQEAAGALAEAAVERMKAGETPEAVAADLGGTSLDARNVTRSAQEQSSLSDSIRALIFDLKKDEVATDRSADNDGYVVVRVNEIVAGDPEKATTEVASLQDGIARGLMDELLGQYQHWLLEQYKPEVNNAVVTQLFRKDAE
ncbi:SurA N-terminal domain-containing protein [Gimibacter soli]|uniref:Parvulin-like PPIase n=1 Tax=Gimibacter soli TaxID=3024400 RepID=A0AAF0BKG8_9PROT|nr:SurA N-terminal domain-containing protein [Gimibacter soli]WCL52952.1 SurA N-terminal domain-containing protein [Gimibacter soli]